MCFSSFVHTTCSLSVFDWYLAFTGAYLRSLGSIPKLPDSKRTVIQPGSSRLRTAHNTGLSPSLAASSNALDAVPGPNKHPPLYSTTRITRPPAPITNLGSGRFTRRY